MIAEREAWNAVLARDASLDGAFVYAVRSTGVFCRPSCPARRPLRGNVEFFASASAARGAGFRACRRCRPERTISPAPIEEAVQQLAREIVAQPARSFALRDLARRAGYSPSHLQRSFRSILGSSPKELQAAARTAAFKAALRGNASVADAVYAAGFGSTSRVYEKSDARLGMTPRAWRSGGAGEVIAHACAHTPLGLLIIGATDRGICYLQFGASEEALAADLACQFPAATHAPMPATHAAQFAVWMEALNRHLRGHEPRLDPPLDLRGTAFQLIVWKFLGTIPYGELRSYGEIAAAIGKPRAARAVASACAGNRVAIAVPCHRVVRGTGELGGYRWGIARKRVLIETERAATAILLRRGAQRTRSVALRSQSEALVRSPAR